MVRAQRVRGCMGKLESPLWERGGCTAPSTSPSLPKPGSIPIKNLLLLLSTNTLALAYDAFTDILSHSRLPWMPIQPDYVFPSLHSPEAKPHTGFEYGLFIWEVTSSEWKKTNKGYVNEQTISLGG